MKKIIVIMACIFLAKNNHLQAQENNNITTYNVLTPINNNPKVVTWADKDSNLYYLSANVQMPKHLVNYDEYYTNAYYVKQAKTITPLLCFDKFKNSQNLQYSVCGNNEDIIIDWTNINNKKVVDNISQSANNNNTTYTFKPFNVKHAAITVKIRNIKDTNDVLKMFFITKPIAEIPIEVFALLHGESCIVLNNKISDTAFYSCNKLDSVTYFIKTILPKELLQLAYNFDFTKNGFINSHAGASGEGTSIMQNLKYKNGLYTFKLSDIQNNFTNFLNNKYTKGKLTIQFHSTLQKSSKAKEGTCNKFVTVLLQPTKFYAFVEQIKQILYIIIPLLIIGLLIFIRIKMVKLRKQKQLTNENKLKLEALRGQLNPHFIFNALTSIQNLVQQNKNEVANTYLNKFSRLTRNVLEHSQQELIVIEDEIKLIEDYLQMEQLRFGFTYSINVENSIDVNNVQVPTMLLQPIVENAVKYGVSDLLENGLIKVNFTQRQDDIIITITDNGSGFNFNTVKKGKGILVTQQRIELLQQIYKYNKLNIEYNSNSKLGTTVTIKLINWLR